MIVFCNENDKEVIEAKKNLYTQENGNWIVNEDLLHRQLSNNTILYSERPSMEKLDVQFDLIKSSGEPSFGNLAEMKRRRPDAQGGNPLTSRCGFR